MLSRVLLVFALIGVLPRLSSAQVFSVPVRWCVIANDANGNGRVDPGEEGAPAFTNPGMVGEVDTDNVLWRRHERPTDTIFIPESSITFRSALYNIVEDKNLRFPIVPDPDPNPTGDTFWQYGDVVHPQQSGFEWNAAHNACVNAWRDVHGVENIGVVVINANNVRTLSGDSEPGVATLGRILLRDNAYVLPGSPLNTFPVSDHVDKHFAHEMGHALGDLRHTCSDQNVMSNRRTDPNNDGLVDNIHLSNSIAHVTSAGANGVECSGGDDTTVTVNQTQLLRAAAQAMPGCKIAGTNTDCTAFSDIRADRIRDASISFADLSTFTASSRDGAVRLVHEPMGPIVRWRTTRRDDYYDFYAFIDQDLNAATGGEAKSLKLPVDFLGAELVTRVRVQNLDAKGFLYTPTVWRFVAGGFQEVMDRRIRAFAVPLTVSSSRGQAHLADQVTLELPSEIFGVSVMSFRLQAAVLAVAGEPRLLDLLDEDRTLPGRNFRWRSPMFPVCSATPDPVGRLGAITVNSTGLLPNRPVHLIFGDRHIANGNAGATGSVSISTAIPATARDGAHLITVGTDGTALTADCIVTVRGGPAPPADDGSGVRRPFEYAAKLLCGVQPEPGNLRLPRGAYNTIVNVRNAGSSAVTISKDLALAYPPGDQRAGEVLGVSEDFLRPGETLAVDCADIARRLFNGKLPASYIDGWLVVRSRDRLDVTTVHTAAEVSGNRPGNIRSIDVEPVAERQPPTIPPAVGR